MKVIMHFWPAGAPAWACHSTWRIGSASTEDTLEVTCKICQRSKPFVGTLIRELKQLREAEARLRLVKRLAAAQREAKAARALATVRREGAMLLPTAYRDEEAEGK